MLHVVHDDVDIAGWIRRYPLASHREALDRQDAEGFRYYAPSDILTPSDLALTEQMRAEVGGPSAMGPAVPLDLLLPAFGEPARREVSKVGGVPYRRSDTPWPQGRNGRPMSFLAQFCFADSVDILRDALSGPPADDVLLIFQDGEAEPWGTNRNYGSSLHFEWQPLDMPAHELIAPADVPPQPVVWRPTYFERYRTSEHPGPPEEQEKRMDSRGLSGRYRASKIGGIPAWQQGEEEAEGLGRYFASLHSVKPGGVEYPFPNLPVSPWGEWPFKEGFLMLGDLGTLYLFVGDDGRINWLTQCG